MRDINMNSIRSIDRAFDILQTFTIERPSLTIDQIAGMTGIPNSTVYRILYTLERRGLVQFDSATSTYKPGFRLIEFGALISSVLDLHQEAEAMLIDLHFKTRQTILMAVCDDDHIIYIFKKENQEGLKFSSLVGQRRPLLYGILGPVLLAHLPDALIRNILNKPIPKHTPYTITDPQQIYQRLQGIKREGLYIESNETSIGVTGVGAPVFNVRRKAVAAIGVIGPSVQLSGDALENAKIALLDTARNISVKMGLTDEHQ